MKRESRPLGFTLIELMIAVAIVGILASVAIPSFQKQVLRTKTTERTAIMMRIKQAIQDYYLRNGVSIAPGRPATLIGRPNPPGAPTSNRRMMVTNYEEWNDYFSGPTGGSSVSSDIEGSVYYQYSFTVVDTPETASITVVASGDLDGDGDLSTKRIVWTRVAGAYQFQPDAEFPAPGEEDVTTF